MSQELEVFDEMRKDIAVFVAPVNQLVVADDLSSASAIDVAKQIKGYLAEIEKKRKGLVGPLNDRVKLINEYCKRITLPLDQAENHVKGQLNKFAEHKEIVRQRALKKAEDERLELEQRMQQERELRESELMEKQIADATTLTEGTTLFGAVATDQMLAEIDEKQKREWEAAQALLDQEEMIKGLEHKQRIFDANQNQIKSARKNYYCEATDLNKVPKEFLIVTLNTKSVIAAAKAGVKDIPGVRIWTEMKVAIGLNTYNPKVK